MNRDSDGASPLVVAVAVALVAVAALAPSLVASRPANEIPVSERPGGAPSLADPADQVWEDVPSKTVELASAPSDAPDAGNTTIEAVAVQAAQTNRWLYVRLSWEDTTVDDQPPANLSANPPRKTSTDAVAVQLPAEVGTEPGIAMGSTRTPVNIWYWGALSGGQELVAGGQGTTSHVPGSQVETNATHEDGRWHVVVARNLEAPGQDRTDLRQNEDVSAAFAVWNGSNYERAGQKAVSGWLYFALGPGPQGPPYETILWGVAGLAILVVVVATATGVRRTPEE